MNKDISPNNKEHSLELQKHHIGNEISFTWDDSDDD